MEEVYDTWQDFLDDWGEPDSSNVPFELCIHAADKSAIIWIAQSRKLTVWYCAINQCDKDTVMAWYNKHSGIATTNYYGFR